MQERKQASIACPVFLFVCCYTVYFLPNIHRLLQMNWVAEGSFVGPTSLARLQTPQLSPGILGHIRTQKHPFKLSALSKNRPADAQKLLLLQPYKPHTP